MQKESLHNKSLMGFKIFTSWRPQPMKIKIRIFRTIFWKLNTKVITRSKLEQNLKFFITYVWVDFLRNFLYKINVDIFCKNLRDFRFVFSVFFFSLFFEYKLLSLNKGYLKLQIADAAKEGEQTTKRFLFNFLQ